MQPVALGPVAIELGLDVAVEDRSYLFGLQRCAARGADDDAHAIGADERPASLDRSVAIAM